MTPRNHALTVTLLILLMAVLPLGTSYSAEQTKVFRAGAHAIDITPVELPVIVNGGMLEREATKIVDRLHARCLVLDDGNSQIAIVVVDSCMLPRDLLDEAKEQAEKSTGIPTNRILISATHTHSAPASMGCLGSDRDERYCDFLVPRLVKGIELAQKNLIPAKIGWAVGKDGKNVACRRWQMKPGTAPVVKFTGTTSSQAQMHPGYGNKNAIKETGPVDPLVTVLSIQTLQSRPLAVLANYSMHYVGAPAISADYFSVFCQELTTMIGGEVSDPPFMAALSNGTSGDTWLLDHSRPKRTFDRFSIAAEVARAAYDGYQSIEYHSWVPIVMEEKLLELGVRLPNEAEVAEAKKYLQQHKVEKPKDTTQVYAREAILLNEMPPTRELKIQAIRLGEMGIVGIPNEVYASTGVKIKAESVLQPTMNISLANGSEGYIPPPDQLKLGGYTTWRARTSCLEPQAEPKIRTTALELLKQVADSQ